MDDDFWKAVREKERASTASSRTGALNIALLFGTAVVALTLILTPMLADKSKSSVFASAPSEFDTITTGSIPKSRRAASAIQSAGACFSRRQVPFVWFRATEAGSGC